MLLYSQNYSGILFVYQLFIYLQLQKFEMGNSESTNQSIYSIEDILTPKKNLQQWKQKYMTLYIDDNGYECIKCTCSLCMSADQGFKLWKRKSIVCHANFASGRYICPFQHSTCFKFHSSSHLLNHCRKYHPDEIIWSRRITREKYFVCQYCGNNYLSNGNLRRHLRKMHLV